MKLGFDSDRCTGIGICESFAPGAFEVDDNGDLIIHHDAITPDNRDEIDRAIDGCPTQALHWV